MIRPEVLAVAADRGTALHSLFARRLAGLMIFPEELEDALIGYYQSFENWLDLMVSQVVMVEKTLTDPIQGFQGTPDAIVQIKGDAALTLMDWKSPQVATKTWAIQVAAYRVLAEKAGYPIKRVATLQPHPKGKRAKFTEYSRGSQRDYAIFLSALNCHRYFYQEA